ncbi:MAG: lysylphosphatidylglycerol synthase domain-containing protein [Vicinamibacterales bacterium]
MTPDSRQRLWTRLALTAGLVLLVVAVRSTDWTFVRSHASSLLPSALAAIAISGAWHVVRTWAWQACFPVRAVAWRRLFRVRLAAEAVSYVTVRGVAGEPLKVLLLRDQVTADRATAAVALERLAYMICTTLLVGVGASVAWARLPLTPAWRSVFLAFAAGSVLVAGGVALLLRRAAASASRRPVTPPPERLTRLRAFTAGVGLHLQAALHAGPARILSLAGASVAGYLLMAFEAWAVLRIGGWPISFGQAVAIETLTRVMSMATAVIPANLGALEVASLAAAAAAGTPGGALLAVARRLRGLFWAGAGFAVFPGGLRGQTPSAQRPDDSGDRPLLYVAHDARIETPPDARLAGLPLGERVIRVALKAGFQRILVWAPGRQPAPGSKWAAVTVVRTPDAWRRELANLPEDTVLTAIGPGTLVSPRLLEDAALVLHAGGVAQDVPAGSAFPVSGVLQVPLHLARRVDDLASALVDRVWSPLPTPTGEEVSSGHASLALRMPTMAAHAAADATLQRSVFKPTDATMARFNRRMSLPISTALLRTPVSANAMSVFVCALGLFSGWLFSVGEYGAGLAGASISLAASILDGCDGEIARLKYQESALGCWLETIGDYSYYIAIFIGLTVGAVKQTGAPFMATLGAAGIAGTLLSFALLIYLRRTITQGRPETLHAVARTRFKAESSWWTRLVWRLSFVATRAAMPYGILALAIVGLLPAVVVLCAIGANVYWLSLVFKLPALLGQPAPMPWAPVVLAAEAGLASPGQPSRPTGA